MTNLAEISLIDNITSEYIAMKFENDCLTWYPWFEHCLHENGVKFTGGPYMQVLLDDDWN